MSSDVINNLSLLWFVQLLTMSLMFALSLQLGASLWKCTRPTRKVERKKIHRKGGTRAKSVGISSLAFRISLACSVHVEYNSTSLYNYYVRPTRLL